MVNLTILNEACLSQIVQEDRRLNSQPVRSNFKQIIRPLSIKNITISDIDGPIGAAIFLSASSTVGSIENREALARRKLEARDLRR